jgi:hypothetical protein
MAGKNKAAMGNNIVVKNPTKKESVVKSVAPKGAVPAYKGGGKMMTGYKMGGKVSSKKK